MKAVILMLDLHGRLLGIAGPYNWTLAQCNANVEFHVKVLALPPAVPGIDRRVKTYQCRMVGGQQRNI